MLIIRLICCLLLAITLSACATAPKPSKSHVLIAPDIYLDLPAVNSYGASVEAAQMIKANYKHRIMALQSQVSITPQRVILVGLDPMGQTLMRITWTASGITTEKAGLLPPLFQAEHVLADFVLLNWPEEIVRQSLRGKNIEFIATPNARILKQNDQEILRADFNRSSDNHPLSGNIRYKHLIWKYQLDIQSKGQAL